MKPPAELSPQALALLEDLKRPSETLSDVVFRLAQWEDEARRGRPLEDDRSAVC